MSSAAGKVVLISGGARGMGAAHVEALVSQGARAVIGDLLDDAGRAVAVPWATRAISCISTLPTPIGGTSPSRRPSRCSAA